MPQIIDIVPVQELWRVKGAPMHMMLTHLMKYPEYLEFYKNEKGYLILDNSIIEAGKAMPIWDVIEAAKKVDADEVILTDVYQDGEASIRATEGALEWIVQEGLQNEFRYMAVPQGSDEKEFAASFRKLATYSEVNVLGVPKYLADYSMRGRADFEYLWDGVSKQIHLLGCKYSWIELLLFRAPESIRSMDSCLRGYFTKYGTNLRSVGTLDLERPFGTCIGRWMQASSFHDLMGTSWYHYGGPTSKGDSYE